MHHGHPALGSTRVLEITAQGATELGLRWIAALLLLGAAAAVPLGAAYDSTPFDRFFVDIIIRAPGVLTVSDVEAWLNEYVLAASSASPLRVPPTNITLVPL